MIRKILNSLGKNRKEIINSINSNTTLRQLDSIDIGKLKSNLTTIDYETFLDAIYQEDILHRDNAAYKMLDAPKNNHTQSKDVNLPDEFRLEDPEEEVQIELEEEYRFVLVKKSKPNPTVVMPTKLLQQLGDPSITADFKELKFNKKNY